MLTLSARHEKAKESYEERLEDAGNRRRRGGEKAGEIKDEFGLHRGVIARLRGKPKCIKGLDDAAVLLLAHYFRTRLGGDELVSGQELIYKLQIEPEHSITYLAALDDLQRRQWLYLAKMENDVLFENPPLCWLSAQIIPGRTFHEAINGGMSTTAFASNDDYLDAVLGYLDRLTKGDRDTSGFFWDNEANGRPFYDGRWQHIEQRLLQTPTSLPAATLREKFRLSYYQYFCLLGLFGVQENIVDYDFNDPQDAIRLFTHKRSERQQMREHLFGENSPLRKRRLIEADGGEFGQSLRVAPAGIAALTGHRPRGRGNAALLRHLQRSQIFAAELPRLKKDSVVLPSAVQEAMTAILGGESPRGLRQRRAWCRSLPSEWGAPTGTTILLYGPPGTGKTLTAQYLASELRRPLLKVDAASVLSMWVGESEKHVRRIFDSYADLQRDLGAAPVLLLNEADQLLGSRMASADSVDKMHNNMQNLFLEGLERFSGILVATTNRRELLEAAFSRRFTYKLELPPPDQGLRRRLWERHLPASRLASDFDFTALAEMNLTGGEIRLVVEKAVRRAFCRGDNLLRQKDLQELAREELRVRPQAGGYGQGHIGFGR